MAIRAPDGANNNKNCLTPPCTSAGNGDDVDDTVIAVAVAVADGVVYVASPSQTCIDILMGKFEENLLLHIRFFLLPLTPPFSESWQRSLREKVLFLCKIKIYCDFCVFFLWLKLCI